MNYSAERLERFNWPVSVKRKIDAPAHSIWLAISRPGNLKDCHPFCKNNPVHQWSGVGSKDAIYYYSGWVYQREFTNWVEGVGYDLFIGREGGRKSCVSWRIIERSEDRNTLNITIYPHVLQNISVPIRWMPYRFYIEPMLQDYLESVVRGFDWFITTGKPVRRNQFGSHKWVSGNCA